MQTIRLTLAIGKIRETEFIENNWVLNRINTKTEELRSKYKQKAGKYRWPEPLTRSDAGNSLKFGGAWLDCHQLQLREPHWAADTAISGDSSRHHKKCWPVRLFRSFTTDWSSGAGDYGWSQPAFFSCKTEENNWHFWPPYGWTLLLPSLHKTSQTQKVNLNAGWQRKGMYLL